MNEEDIINGLREGEVVDTPLTDTDITKIHVMKIHTITAIKIYPDGRRYVDKSLSYSWIEGNQIVAPKKKKQMREAVKSEIAGEESY